MPLNELIQQGWAEHDSETEAVAQRLEAGVDLIEDSQGATQFMHLVNHAIGGHLKDRQRALNLCEVAFARAGEQPDPGPTLYLAVARRLGGNEAGAATLQAQLGEDESALVRVNMLVAEGHMNAGDWDQVVTLYGETLARATSLPEGHAGERVTANVSNNIASELLEISERTEQQDQLMERAAHAAKQFWSRVGNWVNSARGDYLLSLVYTALDQPDQGRAYAEQGLKTIEEADGEEKVDEAFLHLARARACRDASDTEAQHASLNHAKTLAADFDAGLISWFEGELAKSV